MFGKRHITKSSLLSLRNNYNGFTFIELLVVVATMALLFTVGFANYRGFQERQRLISAARAFKADLRFAQEQALAGIKPTSCGSLDGYKVTWQSLTSYRIEANCDGNPTGIVVKTVDLTKNFYGIKITSFSAVYFKILGRGTNANPTLTMTISDNKTPPNTIQVVVTKGGEIN